MARIKSKWWRPAPLTYIRSQFELHQKENEYRWWLAAERQWSLAQVDLYIRQQREWLANQEVACGTHSTATNAEHIGSATLASW